MSEGKLPLPSSGGPGPTTFDLRPFRSSVRFTEMPGFRAFVLVGLAFTALGFVLGVVVGSAAPPPSGQRWTVEVPLATALTGGAGFVPLILAALTRPTRYLVALRLDPDGFTLERSSGPDRRFRWDDPELAVSIARPVNPPIRSASGVDVERFVALPGFVDGRVGSEARRALLDAARQHGLRVREEPMQVPGERRSSAPSGGIAYGFAGAGPVPGGPLEGPVGMLEPTPAEVLVLPAKFDLRGLRTAQFESGPSGTVKNGLQELTVTEVGIDFVDASGRRGSVRWNSPEVRLELLRRVASPAEPIRRDSAVWTISAHEKGGTSAPARRAILRGFNSGLVDGRCSAAIEASAISAGLWVGSVRFPGPGSPSFWLVITQVKNRGAGMYVA